MKNVKDVVRQGLCVGCGVCKDLCPKKCLEISHGIVNTPVVKESECITCGRCLNVCPGKGVKIEELSKSYYANGNVAHDSYIGYYNDCFSGYSNDFDIRYRSSSGGAVSQFLIFLLEKNVVDGAIVVGYQKNNPMKPIAYIARNKQDVLNARGSKYCVVAYDGIISEIEHTDGRFVVVGLPCHIHGFRQAARLSKGLKEKLAGYFAIYCSSEKNMLSQDYYLYRYNVEKDKIARFSYRDYGCMGSMVFEDATGKDLVKRIPCLDYYTGVKGFFTPWRCLLCIDHFGELADICFGDIQVGQYKNDKIGVNSIISRSSYWTDMLLKAKEEGLLHLDRVDKSTVISSQRFCAYQKKGPGVVAEFKLRKLCGKSVPEYDQPFVSSQLPLKIYCKSIARVIMRFIGAHRYLWWVIRLFER